MENRPEAGQLSEVERELREAEQAQAEAEAAAQRAAAARAEADAARQRAAQEQEERRRRWAQEVVDRYDADLTAAEDAVRAASERFGEAAVRDLPGALTAYLAWAEATLRHYALQVRVESVAPVLDLAASPAQRLPLPPFSEALDAAIGRHVAAVSARIRDEAAAEIRERLDADPLAGVRAAG